MANLSTGGSPLGETPLIRKIREYRNIRKFGREFEHAIDRKYYADDCPILRDFLKGSPPSRVVRTLARGVTRSQYAHMLGMVFRSHSAVKKGDLVEFQYGRSFDLSRHFAVNLVAKTLKRSPKSLKTHHRNLIVLPRLNLKMGVHNGREFAPVRIKPSHEWRRLGELGAANTRKKVVHGKAGKGSTQGSKHVALK